MKTEKTANKKEKVSLSPKESWLKIGKGLISNQACFESGKMPFYWAILIFVVSVVLTWVPFLKKGYTTDNSAIFDTAGNAEVDKGVKSFLEADYTKKFVIKGETKMLDMTAGFEGITTEEANTANREKKIKGEITSLLKGTYKDDGSRTDTYVKKENLTNLSYDYYFDAFATKKTSTIDDPNTSTTTTTTSTSDANKIDYDNSGMNVYLMTYYFPTLNTNETKFNAYFQNFVYNEIFNLNTDGKMQNYPHSFLFLTQDSLIMYVFNLNSYKNMNVTSNFVGKLTDGFASVTSDTNFLSFLRNGDNTLSMTDTYTNFRKVTNDAVRKTAIDKVWNNILVLSIIDVCVVLISAVILLVMHKRKSSIMRDVNFLNTLVEACVFFLTPAILGMVIGFMNDSYAYMMIIGGVLIRIVWGSNKLMPPIGSEQDKPLYQARS